MSMMKMNQVQQGFSVTKATYQIEIIPTNEDQHLIGLLIQKCPTVKCSSSMLMAAPVHSFEAIHLHSCASQHHLHTKWSVIFNRSL